MKKPEASWKEYKFRFSDMQLTIIDGPGAEWTCVLNGSRRRDPRPERSARRKKGGHAARPG
jgi:hypothetical protein